MAVAMALSNLNVELYGGPGGGLGGGPGGRGGLLKKLNPSERDAENTVMSQPTTFASVNNPKLPSVVSVPEFCGAGLPPSSAFALILAANEPCLFNARPGEHSMVD